MSEPCSEALESAARRVLAQIGVPLHERATVAAMESDGLRDSDAARIVPGARTLFDAGPAVHARCLDLGETAATLAPPRNADEDRAPPRWQRLVRNYWLGIAYMLPLVAQGICVVVLGVSLWGSAGLTRPQQTAIAVALVATLVVTGPLTHALTRRMFHYWFQWDLDAVRRTACRGMALGIAVGAVSGALAAGVAAATGRLGQAGLTLVAFLALQPGIWIANSALFVIRKAWWAGLAVLLPTIPVWAGLRLGLPALAVHVAGLAAANALLVGGAVVLLRRRARGWPAARRPLPRAVLPLAVAGHAAWGLVYFALIFSDRVVAWLEPGGTVAWRPSYEAALQLALVPLVLTLPLLEHVLVRLSEALREAERRSSPDDLPAALRAAERGFARSVLGAGAAYAAMATAVWVLVDRAGASLPLGVGRLVAGGGGRMALVAALVAYGLFVLALGVCAAFQLLGRPWPMVAAGAPAVAVDLAVGLAARAHGPPEAAALGLVAGGAVFAAIALAMWLRTRRRLDYWWYASG